MERTVNDIVVDASVDQVMQIIADFEAYPDWATGVKSADVLERTPDTRPRIVRMRLDSPPIRDEFCLEYQWVSDRRVQWRLFDSLDSMLTAIDGSYVLTKLAPQRTRVTYQLSVDVAMPLLGMLKRKAEKVIIDSALKGLKSRCESREG